MRNLIVSSFLFLSFCLITGGIGCKKKVEDSQLTVLHGFEKEDVKSWDPANAYDSVSLDLVPNIYETLYQYAYLSRIFKLEPLLAAAMPQVSADKLTLNISIKRNLKFQDDPCFKDTNGKGREVKAQDFVYELKRLALPSLQTQGWWILDGKVLGASDFHDRLSKAKNDKERERVFEEGFEGVSALDDYSLQIKLVKPDPRFIFALAMSFTAPVPREAVSSYADKNGNITDHPVGTGPFLLKRWKRNHEIVLERNPNFHQELYPTAASPSFQKLGMLEDAGKKLPFLDQLVIEIVKEAQPRWLDFMNGNADFILLPKDNFKQAITDEVNLSHDLVKHGLRLSIETGVIIKYIAFNMKDKILGSNKYLRQALSAAIDRDEWINIFTNGTGKAMVNAVPPGIPDRPRTNKIKYDFDLSHAKALLERAGYPNGKGLPPLKFDLRGTSTTDRQLADFFTTQFSKIGVRLDVISSTFPRFLEKVRQGDFQISYKEWWMDYPDAENVYQLLYGPNQSSGSGESNYENPGFDKIYRKILEMEAGHKRAALIQELDNLVQEDCPWAYGYYEASYNLSQPWLLNYRSSDIILNKYKYYRINKEIKTRYLLGL